MSETAFVPDLAWIGAIDHDAVWHQVSIRQILNDPQRWVCLHDPYPMRTVAAWRMVAAFALASVEDGIDDYCQRWADRLDLRQGPVPFAQHRSLAEVLERKTEAGQATMAGIDPRRASGNAALLWDHTRAEDRPAYTPAEAVAAMAQTAIVCGSGRATPAEPGAYASGAAGAYNDRVAIVPMHCLGAYLETLVAHYAPAAGDRPVWEWATGRYQPPKRSPKVEPVRTPAGVLEWLTWPARSFLLDWEGDWATGVVMTPGWAPDPDWPRVLHDPFVLPSTNQSHGPDRPMHLSQMHHAVRLTDVAADAEDPDQQQLPLPAHIEAWRQAGGTRMRLIAQHTTQSTQIDGHRVIDIDLKEGVL